MLLAAIRTAAVNRKDTRSPTGGNTGFGNHVRGVRFPDCKELSRVFLHTTLIVDTFAEAFRLRFARLLVTAHDAYWLDAALRAVTGYGTSVIGCDAEVGTERLLDAGDTPDGRPGGPLRR